MSTQAEKAETFRALHARDGAFLIPNPWDIGTARLLASLGFEALATTSAGYAFSVGRRDNMVGRDETLAHASAIAATTDLPVSADLEDGFGDTPALAAETFRLAAAGGVVGGSIEDATRRPEEPLYALEAAAERVRAVVDAVRACPFPFTVTARAENYLVGPPGLGRYHPPLASLPGRRGRRALRARADNERGHRYGSALRGPARQRGHGPAGRADDPVRVGRDWGQAGECRQRAFTGGARRVPEGGNRDA